MRDFDVWQKLKDEIIETARVIAGLPTEALLSATGAFFVLGLMGGEFFWVPFGGTLLPALFRLYSLYETRSTRRLVAEVERRQRIFEEKERIWASTLPEAEKQRLSQALDKLIEVEEPSPKQLRD